MAPNPQRVYRKSIILLVLCFVLGIPSKVYSAPRSLPAEGGGGAPSPCCGEGNPTPQASSFISVDWPSPRYFERVPEHLNYSNVNLFTKSLDGYREKIGAAVIEYDERIPGTTNNVGNFLLQAVTFQNGTEIYLPTVDTTLGALPVLQVGLQLYPLKLIFSEDYQTPSFTTVHRDGYTLQKHGRFLFQREQGPPAQTPPSKLFDTGTRTVYSFVEAGGIYFPNRAELLDGFVVNFIYGDALNPTFITSARLERNGEHVETITLTYASGRLQTLISSLDAGRNVKVNYDVFGNVFSLFQGGNLTETGAVDGIKYQYSPTGSGSTLKYILYSVTNLRGKELIRFFLIDVDTANGRRTVYQGVRLGPGTVNGSQVYATSFHYPSDNIVLITTPQAPQNPLTVTLHPTRGLATKMTDTLCPDPLEEIEFIADGQPNEGLLYRDKVRPRCGQLIVHTFQYNTVGDLTGVVTTGGTQSVTMGLDYTKVTLPNGTILKEVGKVTDPLGGDVIYGYNSATGELNSIEDNGENLQASFQYEYFDAGKKSLKQLTTTNTNSRRDSLSFDGAGRLVESSLNIDTANKVSTTIGYDPQKGRLRTITDQKGNTTSVQYRDDDAGIAADLRVKRAQLVSPDGTQSLTYGYNSDFPALVNTVTVSATKNTNTQTLSATYGYASGTPYPTTLQVQGSGLATPVTLGKLYYDPPTMNITKVCGFSSNGTDQNCTQLYYKESSAGAFAGYPSYSVTDGPVGGSYTSRINYDSYGNAEGATFTDNTKSVSTKVTFDELNRVKEEILNPSETELQAKSVYQYDSASKVTNVKEYVGGQLVADVTSTFDNSGKSSRLKVVSDSVSDLHATYNYADPAKRLTSATTYSPGNSVLSSLSISSTDYDLYDRPTKLTSLFDGVGTKVSQFGFNKFGELEFYTDHLGNRASFDYDSLGRLESINNPLNFITLAYNIDSNGFGLLTETTSNVTNDNALTFPQAIEEKSDALGRTVEIFNQQSRIRTENSFDTKGRLFEFSNSYEGSGASETFSFVYGGFDAAIQTRHNGDVLSELRFGNLGDLVELKNARSQPTTFEYDLFSRLKKINYPDGTSDTVTEYKYLTDGRLRVTEVNRAGDTSTSLFNTRGLLTTRLVQSQEYGSFIQALVYDGTTSRLSTNTVTAGGSTKSMSYVYDDAGRVSEETTHVTSATNDYEFTIGKSYYPDGALKSHLYPNGKETLYERDDWNRIVRIALNGSTRATYHYDGPLLTGIDLGSVSRTFDYTGSAPLPLLYGLEDKLGSNVLSSVTYTYDSQYQPSTRMDTGIRGTSEQFTYNSHHSLTQYTLSSSLLTGGPITRNYNTQLDGVLGAVQAPNSVFALPLSFGYDLRGNPLQEAAPNGKTFAWTHSGLDAVIDQQSGYTEEMTQDAWGRYIRIDRLDSQGDWSSTTYGRDNGMVLWQHDE